MTSKKNEVKYTYDRTLWGDVSIHVTVGKTEITCMFADDILQLLTKEKYRDTLESITSELLTKELKKYDESKENTKTKLQWLNTNKK